MKTNIISDFQICISVPLIECKCLRCNKNYQKNFDQNVKSRFVNTLLTIV